MSSLTRKK